MDACAKILHISPPLVVFIVGKGGLKAGTVNFKTPFIVLPSDLIDKSSPKALRFTIGCQMGHIKCDHVFYKILTEDYLEQTKIVQEKQALVLEELPKPVQNGIGPRQRSERLQSEHPFIFQRIRALQDYAESEAYQKLFEATH